MNSAPTQMSNYKSLKTYEYATVHDKRNFEDGLKLIIWRWGDYPGLSQYAQFNKGPYQRKGGWFCPEPERDDVKKKAKVRGREDAILLALKMEVRSLTQGMQAASRTWEW